MSALTMLTILASALRWYPVELERVVDGDTFVVDVELGFGVVLDDERIRLARIDTPELYRGSKEERARGREAKRVASEWLGANSPLVLVTEGKRGKYGRIIGDLCKFDDHEECVGGFLQAEGWAK